MLENRETFIYIKVATKDIDFINKIIEGYEGLALTTTVDSKEGIVKFSTYYRLKKALIEILNEIPRQIEFLDIN